MDYLLIPLCIAAFAAIYLVQKKMAQQRAASRQQAAQQNADGPVEGGDSVTAPNASADESTDQNERQGLQTVAPEMPAAEEEPINLGQPSAIPLGAAPEQAENAAGAEAIAMPAAQSPEQDNASGAHEELVEYEEPDASEPDMSGSLDTPELINVDFGEYEDLSEIMPDPAVRLERLRELEAASAGLPGYAQSEQALRNKLDQSKALSQLAEREHDPAQRQIRANESFAACLQAFNGMTGIDEECLAMLHDCLLMQASFKNDNREKARVYINGASLFASVDPYAFALLEDERVLDNFTRDMVDGLSAQFAEGQSAKSSHIYNEDLKLADLKSPYDIPPGVRFSAAAGHHTNDLWLMKQYEGSLLTLAGALLPQGTKRSQILDYAAKTLAAHSGNYPFEFHISTFSARQMVRLIDNLEELLRVEPDCRDAWMALALTYKARDKDLEGHVARFWLDRAMSAMHRALRHIRPDLFVIHNYAQFLLTTPSASLDEWWSNANRARRFVLDQMPSFGDQTVLFSYYNLLTQNIVRKLMLIQKLWRELPDEMPLAEKSAAAHAGLLSTHPDWGAFTSKQKEAREEYMIMRNSMAEEIYSVIADREESLAPAPELEPEPRFKKWEDCLTAPTEQTATGTPEAAAYAAEQLIWVACSIPPLENMDYTLYMKQPEEMGVFWSNNASTATAGEVERLLCAISTLYLLYSARCFGVDADGGDNWPMILRDLIFSRNDPAQITKVLEHGSTGTLAAAQHLERIAKAPSHLLAGLYYYSGECLRMQAWYAAPDDSEGSGGKDAATLRQEAEELYEQADSLMPGCANYGLAALAAVNGKADLASKLLADASAQFGKTKLYMSIDRDMEALPSPEPTGRLNEQATP